MNTNTNNDGKLNNFISAVYSEADKKSNEIIETAQKNSDDILAEVDRKANEDASKFVSDTTKKIGIKTVKTIAKAELDGKKSILAKREELTAKVFSAVEEKLEQFRNTDKYFDFLMNTISREELQEGVKICLMPADMKYAEELKKALKTSYDFAEDKSIRMGGIMFYYENEGYVIDRTFDNAFKAEEEKFHENNYFGKVLED